MNRHARRRARAFAARDLHLTARGAAPAEAAPSKQQLTYRFTTACPRALLLGTALASTFLVGTLGAPAPAHAVVDCLASAPPSPGPIAVGAADSITCVNTETRISAGTAIELLTGGNAHDIYVNNSGELIAGYIGIGASTTGNNSSITITNSGDITVSSASEHVAIEAVTTGSFSPIDITNSAVLDVTTASGNAYGIRARTNYVSSPITINNTGEIRTTATGGFDAWGIFSSSFISSNNVVNNSAAIVVNATQGFGLGIEARTNGSNSAISVTNSGDITVKSREDADGIDAEADNNNNDSPITINNSGAINTRSTGAEAEAIDASSNGARSGITVVNHGELRVNGVDANGINVATIGQNSPVDITNRAKIWATASDTARGISAASLSDISVNNSADIKAISSQGRADGIFILSFGDNAPTHVTNSGDIYASGKTISFGIAASQFGANRPLTIDNSGSVFAKGPSGAPMGYVAGISVYSQGGLTTINNTGDIGASSHLAIGFNPNSTGRADIFNAGHITGFVNLTEQNDRFFNQAGGVFETKKTSFFNGGNDLFVNQTGATVLAATNPNAREMSGFEGLETFKNSGGTISLVDGGVGDTFTIANTPGGADLKFEGGGYLAVDAELRGPGSTADNFIVDGNVSGQTKVMVNNTSTQPGVFNSQGIPVVFVDGKTPSAGNFVLADGPIDTGFFDYDLFFVPTGSGFWELRSFPGASAQALPKLLTAAQDIWHETSSTWFDRTADLRVVLNGGGSPAYDAGTKSLGETGGNGLTPGVWIKGGGSRLDRQGNATTRAYGNTYTYDLDTELSTIDLQMGVDMGQYDVLSQGDVLIFGVLGGFVGAGLDYDSLGDNFDFSGGQVGAYATYLKGGLFVDTLLNVHLYEIDTPNFGFPDSLNATTVGLRTDAGYRFGSFTGGAFFEPLATIEIAWADIDGFNVGGNKVSFSDDANVRGRIGGRVGTTTQAWEGTMMEPFLIASLWGNLSEDNSARLVSSGTTFQFQDDLDDVWGELSAGVNLFNFSQTTAVFAKVDYTFGEDVQGLGGKAGVRVAW
ncbi:pertactin-like passenger domain-containing protein [Methyloceanibacter caenitepidi]|uniref:Autotransporter domain-containing protein n=1 Tax=Methyloceanibacter caenitepidi TaxID=1384459 RepID=A0A0A8K1K6_9HYPH|nr:pertactin-like passenger domain-containing protein [Methyloceanibacter caenitepidi]BAQ16848.1 hypothetical protein GL4_1390 [Methyloceanibacter caenitepidi]